MTMLTDFHGAEMTGASQLRLIYCEEGANE